MSFLPLCAAAAEPSASSNAVPVLGTTEFVFATRTTPSDPHWYANIGYYGPDANRKAYGKGGRLCRLDPRTGKLTILVEDLEGSIRDPAVDYDGKRIVFAWRKAGTDPYHLYTIQGDGSGLRQLTDGAYDDFEPCWLPDGGIAFVSTRCRRWVQCWLTQVAVIHRCEADGSNIRRLSANVEHDNTPWVLPDGRILYMRWEYVDRSQVHYHHLWTMNPDGTGQTVFFGNLHPGDVYIDAKPIPGGDRVVLIRSPGHGQSEHSGPLAVVSPKRGPDALQEMQTISREGDLRDPWPLNSALFLAARHRTLVTVTADGQCSKLFELPAEFGGVGLHEPRPLQARRREPVIPSRVSPDRTTGLFLLDNVYNGRNMAGVQPGGIRKLLILESLPKPVNYTGGMEPLSCGGTFTLERILGTVPVEPDGSAYFEAPATRSLLFVALDENDLSVKRMQSFTSVAPGETLGCVGCHEPRTGTRAAAYSHPPRAATRAPSRIEPIPGAPDVPDFPRDIQPILDRHCVKCHNVESYAGRVILTGDHGPLYSHAYFTLTARGQLADGRNVPRSNYAPRQLGSGAAPLIAKLGGGHHDVKATPAELTVARAWLDAGAPYPGTYAALGCGMIGGYQENAQVIERDWDWPETRAAQDAFARRCASCHNEKNRVPRALSDDAGRSRHIVFNLTRPAQSLYLLAPLAKSAGGHGDCKPAGTNDFVFASTEDPDYKTLLAMCEAGHRRLEEIKRFDMPGFRPRDAWVREMKRYGILPADLDPATAVIDVYATERKYWDSMGNGW